MSIQTSGANWYRFDSEAQAVAALLTIGIEIPGDYTRGHILSGDSGYSAIPWGEVVQETGETDAEGNAITETLTGYFVLVCGAEQAVLDQWEPWAYRFADDKSWPVEPAGWREQIELCQELATVTDADPIDATPVPARRDLTEAQLARRAARAAANAPVIEQARVTRALRNLIDGMNVEIQTRLPAKLQQTVAAIAANVTLRAQMVKDRAEQVAIAADATKTGAERRAARDERDRLIAEIERIDTELASDRAWRDGYDTLITAQRSARDASVAELITERGRLDALRAARAAG